MVHLLIYLLVDYSMQVLYVQRHVMLSHSFVCI